VKWASIKWHFGEISLRRNEMGFGDKDFGEKSGYPYQKVYCIINNRKRRKHSSFNKEIGRKKGLRRTIILHDMHSYFGILNKFTFSLIEITLLYVKYTSLHIVT
jgi:hypothetical protein